jgi:hypothetical protein
MQTVQAKDCLTVCVDKLAEVPTVFGKLVHLSSVQKQLQRVHGEVFTDWLCCPLERQVNELLACAHSAARSGMLPDKWLSLATYSDLVPGGGINEAERCLYFSDLDIALGVVRDERAAGDECGSAVAAGRNIPTLFMP